MRNNRLSVQTGVSSDSSDGIGYLFSDSNSDDDFGCKTVFNHSNYSNHAATTTSFSNASAPNYNNKFTTTTNIYVEEKDDGPDEHVDERKKYLVPGLVGLQNLGNTCYMNAALQALLSTRLAAYLRNDCFKDRLALNMVLQLADKERKTKKLADVEKVDLKKKELDKKIVNSFTYQLARLFRSMYNKNSIIKPTTIKSCIGTLNDEFKGFGQNDSQELINCILDAIHEQTKAEVEIKFVNLPPDIVEFSKVRMECAGVIQSDTATVSEKETAKNFYKEYKKSNDRSSAILEAYVRWKKGVKKNHSIITDLFTGMFCSVIECSECRNKTRNYEFFNSLSIETAQSGETTLEKCLKDFSSAEILSGDNKYNCEECNKKVDATKNMYIWQSPEILIIQLKRFKSEIRTYVASNLASNTTKTNSTVKFPLEDLVLKDNYMELSRDPDTKYYLNAIVLHKGSVNFGHYIAYAKNAINGEWYEFNDSTVVHIPVAEIEGEIVTENAYVLIYQRDRTSK